jgi:hypothetical protein
MPRSKKPGWVDWQSSSARAIILEDLLPGGPLFQCDKVPDSAILEWYKEKYPNQFYGIVLDQFAARLKDHRKQGLEEYATAQEEEAFFIHDRKLYPRATHNHRGEPKFDMSQAKELLRADVKNREHEDKTARQLQLTREEYKQFGRKIFQNRVLQEIRRSKYIHYLELKRAKGCGAPSEKKKREEKEADAKAAKEAKAKAATEKREKAKEAKAKAATEKREKAKEAKAKAAMEKREKAKEAKAKAATEKREKAASENKERAAKRAAEKREKAASENKERAAKRRKI